MNESRKHEVAVILNKKNNWYLLITASMLEAFKAKGWKHTPEVTPYEANQINRANSIDFESWDKPEEVVSSESVPSTRSEDVTTENVDAPSENVEEKGTTEAVTHLGAESEAARSEPVPTSQQESETVSEDTPSNAASNPESSSSEHTH